MCRRSQAACQISRQMCTRKDALLTSPLTTGQGSSNCLPTLWNCSVFWNYITQVCGSTQEITWPMSGHKDRRIQRLRPFQGAGKGAHHSVSAKRQVAPRPLHRRQQLVRTGNPCCSERRCRCRRCQTCAHDAASKSAPVCLSTRSCCCRAGPPPSCAGFECGLCCAGASKADVRGRIGRGVSRGQASPDKDQPCTRVCRLLSCSARLHAPAACSHL